MNVRPLFLITKLIQLSTLRDIINTYVDTQLSRQELLERFSSSTPLSRDTIDFPAMSYKVVPVSTGRNCGYEYAKVSAEDYDKVISLSSEWRKSSSGYAIFVEKDKSTPDVMRTTYMHKLIFGSQSKHINGDRLDNRRTNLVLSTRKRKMPEPMNEEFVLHTPRFMTYEINKYDSTDPILQSVNGYAIVKFGKKTYSGEVKNGEPCGYGMISQNEAPYDMCGIWTNGKLETGMITYYKPLPLAFDNEARLVTPREVEKVEIVSNGNKLT